MLACAAEREVEESVREVLPHVKRAAVRGSAGAGGTGVVVEIETLGGKVLFVGFRGQSGWVSLGGKGGTDCEGGGGGGGEGGGGKGGAAAAGAAGGGGGESGGQEERSGAIAEGAESLHSLLASASPRYLASFHAKLLQRLEGVDTVGVAEVQGTARNHPGESSVAKNTPWELR